MESGPSGGTLKLISALQAWSDGSVDLQTQSPEG